MTSRLEELLADLDARNADNVSRTESYLELYAHTRANPPDLPWLLMAHLVSRNGGYMMTDVAESLARDDGVFSGDALRELFLFLERANYLIFHDAWHHVIHHLLGRSSALAEGRTTRFIRESWPRYEREKAARGVAPDLERRLVRDLVTNEQNYIERRVVHNARFVAARAIIGFIESIGRETPVVFPPRAAPLDPSGASNAPRFKVGGFAILERRIAAGFRIFDEVLADPERREATFRWSMEHPHTGSRAVYGGKKTLTTREAWPVATVHGLWSGVHAPPEIDPHW